MLAHVAFLVTLLAPVGAARLSPTDRPYHVIVNRANPVTRISRAELSAIFMRKLRSWPDRTIIVPVDLAPTSPVREAFSKSIHGQASAYVIRYWQRLIFAGRAIPPRELASDAAVIEFVRLNASSIGYIDAATVPGDDVRIVEVTE